QVAVAGRLEARHALAAQAERAARLCPGRDGEQDAALEGTDPDLAAEERFLERQRELALEIGAATGEGRVRGQPGDDDQVAAARPTPGELDPGTGVGARRDGDLESLAIDVDQPGGAVVRLV